MIDRLVDRSDEAIGSTQEACSIAPETVAADVRQLLTGEQLETQRILSVYLYGSVLWGGFDPVTSDVDLIVVVAADPPLIESYRQVRRFVHAMPRHYKLDISTSTIEQVELPVACRPYILNSAADHGWLLHGRPTLPQGRRLDKSELVAALNFNARQLSRNYADLPDDCWERIIRGQIKAHFVQLSQLLHSHRPDVPFAPDFEPAVQQATTWFPSLVGRDVLFLEAVRSTDPTLRMESMMTTILHLLDAVSRDDFLRDMHPTASASS